MKDPDAPDIIDLSGRTVGDYRVLRRLGQGGMGDVYLAEQVSLKRKVALKTLKGDLASDPTSLQRFQVEAEAAARATHANIVQVYAIGEWQGVHYMALEYVEGRNLREYVTRRGLLDLGQAVSIMRQVAKALQRAGELGIIHRDIKPENILITRSGEVKVADFGLSRFSAAANRLNLTQTGVAMGTPLYMSPEQVQAQEVDARSDIYSLGVTSYHLLAGFPPFQGQTPFDVALQHVQGQAKPLAEIRPDLPPALCAIVARMMAKKPDDRYQSARELVEELDRLYEPTSKVFSSKTQALPSGPMNIAAPESASVRPGKRTSRMGWLMGSSLVLALIAGGVVGWLRDPSGVSQGSGSAQDVSVVEAPDKARIEGLFSQKRREEFLLEAVKQTASPADNNVQVRTGLDWRIALALVYLDGNRLDEADRFFGDLINNSSQVRAYMVLGRIGRAVVMAFRDRPADSMRVFADVFGDNQPPWERQIRAAIVNKNPRFHQKIAEALARNEANKQTIPSELEELRKPRPVPVPKGPGQRQVSAQGAGNERCGSLVPSCHDHGVVFLRQWAAVEAAADFPAREAGDA